MLTVKGNNVQEKDCYIFPHYTIFKNTLCKPVLAFTKWLAVELPTSVTQCYLCSVLANLRCIKRFLCLNTWQEFVTVQWICCVNNLNGCLTELRKPFPHATFSANNLVGIDLWGVCSLHKFPEWRVIPQQVCELKGWWIPLTTWQYSPYSNPRRLFITQDKLSTSESGDQWPSLGAGVGSPNAAL